MMDSAIKELTWDKVRKEVLSLNPQLAAIIDNISPNGDYTFIKTSYRFGNEILKNAQLQLPTRHHKLLPFDSSQLDKDIKQKLSYCMGSNPVAIVLKNSVELFIELQDRIIPFAIIPVGNVFGTWRFLDVAISHCPKTFIWGMTAGARSIFLLPKISKAISHSKLLNKFHITTDKPNCLLDHWNIFRSLATAQDFGETWDTILLYFTGKWFENRNDKAWTDFYYYLLNNAWQGSGYWRNQFIWDLIFSLIEKNRNIKPPPYLIKQIKHLLAMATGSVLGFTPAIDDSLAPIKKLQEIYIDDYGLKEYTPIIMQPASFSLYDPNSPPVYYSLQLPTAMEFSSKSSERTTTLTDLYLLKSLLNKHISEISSEQLKVESTPLYDAATKANYDFFHSTTGGYKNIRDTKEIPLEDVSFAKLLHDHKNTIFPNKANFLNGCIRISHKAKK